MELEREGRVQRAAEREERDAAAREQVAEAAAEAHASAADEPTPEAAEEPIVPTDDPIGSLPQNETELHNLLLQLSRAEPPISPSRLAALHAHDVFRPLASSRTYSYLLHLAVKQSNKRLTQSLLDELDDRGLARTESIWRTLLRARMREGSVAGVREAVGELRRQGVRPVVSLNWRRDLSSKDPTVFDPSRRFWPEWDPSAREAAEEVVNPLTRKGRQGRRHPNGGPANSTLVLRPADALFTRQRTHMGNRDPTRLAAADIAALVHSLTLDGDAPDAFDVAERWLVANRPKLTPRAADDASPGGSLTPPASAEGSNKPNTTQPALVTPAEVAARSAHAKTAVVLLNILLRSWVATHPPPSDRTIRTFLLAFAARHNIRPGESTLRTLIDGYRGRRSAWLQGKAAVEWFVRHFGIPGTPAPPPPPVPETVAASREASAHLCSSQVSLLLLHLVVHQPLPPERSPYRKRLLHNVRTWWAQVRLHRLATKGSLGALGFRRADLLVDKAIRRGVLEEPEGWRKKEWQWERKVQKEEARKSLCE